ncbi:MAG: hypothetical protein QM704_12475 [Anaeromyxobacteraceae bacterium]
MPLSLEELVARHPARAALGAASGPLGTVELQDSARRHWAVDVRRDPRGRYLQLRPVGVDLERFRASADGHRRDEWLGIAPLEWTAFALLAGGPRAPEPAGDDAELAQHVRRLLDRMVRDAQHRGLVFDEDEE